MDKKEICTYSLITSIAITLFILSDMFFKIIVAGIYVMYGETSNLFNVLMGIIVYTLFWAIFRKSSTSTKICYTLIFFLSIANFIKILYAGEPIYFVDIKFLGNVGSLLGIVTTAPGMVYVKIFVSAIVFGGILVGISILSDKYVLQINNNKIRVSIIIIDIILLLVLFVPSKNTRDFYLDMFLSNDEHLDYNSYVTNVQYYERHTLLSGMYGVYLNNIFLEPEQYNEQILNSELKKHKSEQDKKIEKPNILVVFSEAFFDIDSLEEIEFNIPVTSNFNKLKSEGKFINVLSPSYGGMSENVVFEFLTGGNMAFFPNGYIPVMSLYDRKNSENIPSLVKVLNENNYDSKIIFSKDYYVSEDAYKKIGFEEYIELEDYYDYDMLTDKFCTDYIIEKLEEKNKEEKTFYLLETIENHMPFYEEKYNKYDVDIVKSNLFDESYEIVRAYAQGVYNADKELGRLYEYIKNYEEPTIIIFLGDHLPYLYSATKDFNALDEFKYFNTDDQLLNDYRIHKEQALILANYDISRLEIAEELEMDNLLNSIVNQMDIKINEPFYKWLYSTKNFIINKNVILDENGNRINFQSMNDNIKQIYQLREAMQYKYFMKD